jgi:hypothetical protein
MTEDENDGVTSEPPVSSEGASAPPPSSGGASAPPPSSGGASAPPPSSGGASAPPPSSGGASAPPKTNVLAIVSLVCGLLSIPMVMCCYGLPFNLIGIITGGIAIMQIGKDPDGMKGKGMAIGGIVAGILSFLGIALMIFFFASMSILGSM